MIEDNNKKRDLEGTAAFIFGNHLNVMNLSLADIFYLIQHLDSIWKILKFIQLFPIIFILKPLIQTQPHPVLYSPQSSPCPQWPWHRPLGREGQHTPCPRTPPLSGSRSHQPPWSPEDLQNIHVCSSSYMQSLTSRISLARILPILPCTDHAVDNISAIGCETLSVGDGGHVHLHQLIWLGPPWPQSSPAWHRGH